MTDDRGLGQVIEQYGAALSRITRAYADDGPDREDLHQEILFQVWRSLPSYRGQAALGTWVYRVALNTALTYRRRALRRSRREAPAVPDREVPGPADASPDHEAAVLDEFLAGLGPIDRTVLVLYMEGLSHQEIGEVAGTTAGAVSVRLHRLKRAFTSRYLED